MKAGKHLALMFFLSGFAQTACAKPVITADSQLVFANSRYVLVDDVRLHVRDWGDKNSDACPILLIHDFAGSTFSFRELAPALANAGHPVLAIDLPGFGYSQRSAFSGTAPNAIWQLLEQERPDQSWCLLGHSMGAKLVGQMAALRPDRIQAIVYSNGSPLESSERRKKWLSGSSIVRKAAISWVEKFYLNEKKTHEFLSRAYGRSASSAEVQGYLQPLLMPGSVKAAFSGYSKVWSNDTKAIQISTVPSLVIWGDKDVWNKVQIGQTLAKSITGAKFYMIPGAGHCPIETHFEKVLPSILQRFSEPPKTAQL